MRKAIIVAAAALLACAAPSSATSYVFTNVVFGDSTTLSGSFDVNIYGYLSHDFDIATQDGTLTAYNYTPVINTFHEPGSTTIVFNRADYKGYLHLAFAKPLGAGDDALLTDGQSYECATYATEAGDCTGTARFLAPSPGGSFISPVPEPATWAMMMLGFGGIASALRRRLRNAVGYAY